jgi:hypothetical protein
VKGLFPIDFAYQPPQYVSEPPPLVFSKLFPSLGGPKVHHSYYCLRPEIISDYRDSMECIHREDNQLLTQAFKRTVVMLAK